VLEVMRQPLEDRIISISRAKYSTEYPASFMLLASKKKRPVTPISKHRAMNLL
jgi:magnesium chelatase family protein